MPSPFHGINLASTALRSYQRALEITGHNMANVNTAGYSRQAIDFAQQDPTTFFLTRPLSLGNGVSIASVNRVQDRFLEQRRMSASSELGRLDTYAGHLRQVEALLPEPSGNGIADALNQFFNAWSGLGSNPTDAGQRVQVQLTGQALTLRVRNTYLELQGIRNQTEAGVEGTLARMQQLVDGVANLNRQIKEASLGGASPNDLLDRRDMALRELSELADVQAMTYEDGTVAIYLNQLTLVDASGARTVPTNWDAATQTLSDANGSYSVRGGKLLGLFQSRATIEGYQTQLDTLANTLRTAFNGLHQTGIAANGATNISLFEDAIPQTGAIDFRLSTAVATDPANIAAGISGNAGDGGLALSLSALRESAQPALGGRTISKYFEELIGGIARESAQAQSAYGTARTVADQIDAQISSIRGVSLDEEMANLVRFQRSFQAAARALSVFDQITEDLINLIR